MRYGVDGKTVEGNTAGRGICRDHLGHLRHEFGRHYQLRNNHPLDMAGPAVQVSNYKNEPADAADPFNSCQRSCGQRKSRRRDTVVRIGGRRGSSPRGRALKVGRFRYGLDASRTILGRALACNEARADRDCGRFGSARATSS